MATMQQNQRYSVFGQSAIRRHIDWTGLVWSGLVNYLLQDRMPRPQTLRPIDQHNHFMQSREANEKTTKSPNSKMINKITEAHF